MKKVLIALDYNPSAQNVAETGYAYAKAVGAQVCLVHIITNPEYYAVEYSPIMGYKGFYSKNSDILMEEIIKEAKNFLSSSAQHLGDSNIETYTLEGDTTNRILEFGKEWNADLIVMGSHRHHGIQRLWTEDIATHVLKHSSIPLLIIPTNDK
ncbi:MAG: universal stress protein [Ferruginibacter sp.]